MSRKLGDYVLWTPLNGVDGSLRGSLIARLGSSTWSVNLSRKRKSRRSIGRCWRLSSRDGVLHGAWLGRTGNSERRPGLRMIKGGRDGLGSFSVRRTVNGINISNSSAISTQDEQGFAWDVFLYSSCIIIEIFSVTLLFEITKIHFIHNH